MTTRAAAARARSNSLRQGLDEVPLAADGVPSTLSAPATTPSTTAPVAAKRAVKAPKIAATFFSDLKTFRWATNPVSSLKGIVAVLALYTALELAPHDVVKHNPLKHALFISYPIGGDRYSKGLLDLAFLAFYIVVFSFIRQATTEYFLRPLAKWSGLKTEGKQNRFMEQAYAVLYNVVTAVLGLRAMHNGPAWFYKTDGFWRDYPHWQMTSEIKYYYLLQAAYWLQQMLVLGLRLEKPRSDYYQLIVHHVVTLWLIGWSYAINLTVIGVCVFLSMDIPEIFLAGSKCLNYVGLQHCSEVSFVALLAVWTYMRHYLNIVMMWSVWNEFDLIPAYHRSWTGVNSSNPKDWWVFSGGVTSGRVPAWMKYQILLPIFLLHLVNLFWSYLLWRILYRLVVGVKIADIREEDEDSESEDADQKPVKKESKKSK